LVDVNDEPYRHLTSALVLANRSALSVHANARTVSRPTEATRFALPHASISVDGRSLADWPKPSSLLPRLIPSPGAVEFGEVYLSWSERGLALATIGQDYFDIDLLAYQGAFPLVDAYRVELGVDIGTGPRRFTLFFIPPRTKLHDYPEMAAQLCLGPAEQAIIAGCTEIPGAKAVYFGADQPRITAEILIPWKAFGIEKPASGMPLRTEIAVTSWHRDRWMSLSGRPPGAAMNDPELWRRMRLGNGSQIIETSPAHLGFAPG
jgi:hypothetical protein